MKKIIIVTILFIGCCFSPINAQRFDAGFSLGVNLSELGTSDLNTLGITAGPIVFMKLSKRWQLSTELLYSSNGDYLYDFPVGVNFEKLQLHFVEVPIQLRWIFFQTKEGERFKGSLNFGTSYVHLAGHKAITTNYIDLTPYFDSLTPNAFLVNYGVTMYFNENLAIDFRGNMTTDGTFTLNLKGIWLL